MYPPYSQKREENAMSHQDQVQEKVTAFTEAVKNFADAVERLDEGAATRTPQQGGWSVAQIAWHVGTTNDMLAGVITGDVPMATPAAPEFTENPGVFDGLPAKIQTFPQLEPPAAVTRAEGLAKLRDSQPRMISALQGLSAERAAGYCVSFKFGTLSMYQLADFVNGHVVRHLAQVQRATAEA
jgi:uncharacterized damage-inducible protein DinB